MGAPDLFLGPGAI